MNQHWAGFIDQTLHSTNDTLRRLKERQAHYNAAKKRVREAFANSQFTFSATTTPHPHDCDQNDISPPGKEGRRPGSSARVAGDYTNVSEMKVPPPLPPSGMDYALFGEEPHARPSLGTSGVRWSSGSPASHTSPDLRELTDAYRVVETQLRSVTVELELERTVRKDRERELSDRFSNQISELKASFKQLQVENNHLKESMRVLETRQGLSQAAPDVITGALPPFHPDGLTSSQSGFGVNQLLKDLKTQIPFRGVNSPDASTRDSGDRLSALSHRVADLESGLLQQRRLLENRQHHIDSALQEAVEHKIRLEIERVRSVARETACATTESLIQLRIRAEQSMFHEELRKVSESAGVARELWQENERAVQKWEQNWSAKWEGMENRMQGVETLIKTVRESLATDLETNFKENLDAVRQELSTLRRETQDGKARLAQETASKMEISRLEVMSALQDMLNEQQRQEGLIREAAVRRLIESAVQPLHAGLETAPHALQSLRDSIETRFRQAVSRLDELADGSRTHTLAVAELQRSLAGQSTTVERIRAQLREGAEAQQHTDRAFQALQTAATAAMEGARGQADRLQRAEATLEEHRQRLDGLDAAQQRLGAAVGPLHDHLAGLVAKIQHETQLQEGRLKEHAMATVAKSEQRTLEHLHALSQGHEERVKELILPARLMQRVVVEPSVLSLLAKSLLRHLGLSEEGVIAIAGVPDALRVLEQQQGDLKRRLAARHDGLAREERRGNPAEEEGDRAREAPSPNAMDAEGTLKPDPSTQAAHRWLEQTRLAHGELSREVQELQAELHRALPPLREQLLQHRAAAEETTASLIVRVAALEGQTGSLTEAASQLHRWVGSRLQAAEEGWREAQEAAFQPIRAGIRRLEESYATLDGGFAELAEAVRKAIEEAERGGRAQVEQAAKLAGLEGLVATRLEEVYRDMIQWHQEQLTTLERRLAERAEEQDVRWRAFGEDVERRMREIGDAHGSITDSNPANAPHRGGDWMKEAEERAVGVDDDAHAASAASVKPLKEALLALEQQLGEVATSSEVGLKATADALTGLRDSLQQCVSCVKKELRGDSLMLRIMKAGEVPLSPSAVLPSQREPNATDEATLEALPKLEALDEVFVLFMRQLSYVCHGLATLQENAFATLDLVQQQEMSILAIPTLQEAVLQLASQLKRVSVALPELGEWNSGIEEVMQSTMLRSQEIEIDEQ